MAEKLSPFKEAMKEYKGQVSSVQVRDITPSHLEGLFQGCVAQKNIFFDEGESVTFRYFSPFYKPHEIALPMHLLSYPVRKGTAHFDASILVRRTRAH